MHYISSLAVVFLFIGTAVAQPEARDVLQVVHKVLSSHASVTYSAQMRMKFLSSDDTLSFTGDVRLLREDSDSLFHGYILLTTNDTLCLLYDLQHVFEHNRAKGSAIRYFPHDGQEWAITGSVTERLIWRGFFNPTGILRRAETASDLSFGPDTLIDGRSCIRIYQRFPDRDELTDQSSTLYISKTDSIPILNRSSVRFQGDYEYVEFRLLSWTFGGLEANDFSMQHLAPTDSIIDYVDTRDSAEGALLDIASIAPPLSGIIYPDSSDAVLIAFDGNITVLDFWFMNCYWCIKAMPALERIHEEYTARGVRIYGVNSNDNNATARKRLPNFLEHNPMSYPIVFVSHETVSDYRVTSWPSLYVIDKQGRIAFTQRGFSETLYETLTTELEALLVP